MHERDLVGVAIGCQRCPRGMSYGGHSLVLSRCRECERSNRNFVEALNRAGWNEIAVYLHPYVVEHGLPHLIFAMREATPRVFAPGWLRTLLTQGNIQRQRSDLNVTERLDWPRVLTRARDDLDFREALMGSIGLCADPGSVFALVSSLDETLVMPPNIIIPRKRRTHTARSRA
jgi:hypothetical protein